MEEVNEGFSPVVFSRQFSEFQKILSKKTPKQFIEKRPGSGGQEFDYVNVGYVRRRLDEAFGMFWSFETTEVSTAEMLIRAGHLVVKGRLTVTNPNNGMPIVVKEQFGGSAIKFFRGTKDAIDLANDYKAAASDALKKCASQLGIAADIYEPKVEGKDLNEKKQPIQTTASVAPNPTSKEAPAIRTPSDERINKIQQRQLFTVMTNAAVDKNTFYNFMKKELGKEHTTELTQAEYLRGIEWIQAQKTKSKA